MTFTLTQPRRARSPRHALATAIACAIAAAAAAHAETNAPNVFVTATRNAQPASEVLLDNDTISAEEIAGAGQISLAELLQKRRGVEITANGGSGSYASVFLRGAANYQSVVLVDGVRIGASTSGGATWSTIPLSQIDHIEIAYGPLASLYGADAMGGVIQIFTRDAARAGLSASAALGVGSYGRRQANAAIGGAQGALRYNLAAGSDRSDEFSASTPVAGRYTYNPDRDGYQRDSASGSVAFAVATGHEVGASFLYSGNDVQFDAGPDFNDRGEERLSTMQVYAHDQWLPGWNSKLQLARARDRNASFASYGDGHADTTQDSFAWQNDIALGADTLQLVYEHRGEEVDADTSALSRSRNTNSYAAAYQLRRAGHLATVTVREDRNSQFGAHTTGSLAYGYRISGQLRASASAGTSFRAPSFNELYYPGFGIDSNRPETGRNLEAGLVYADGASQLSATLYRNRLQDLLVYAPVCPVQLASHPYGCAYNIDQATLAGLSLSASGAYQGLSLRATFDLQQARDDTTDKRLARRAREHGSIALDYTVGALKAGIETVFSDARFNDGFESTRLGGYALVNLSASYALAPDWSLMARWNNAGNKHYELAQGYATAGSNVFVGVRWALR
ncbi:MAG: TonB-dependent receptor [Pseudomonadota bacterium]